MGVPHETIIQDYLLTNRHFDPAKVVQSDDQASLQRRTLPHDVLKAYMAADPSYIAAVLDVMDQHAGGSAGYLQDEMGLSRLDIEKLRRMYTI